MSDDPEVRGAVASVSCAATDSHPCGPAKPALTQVPRDWSQIDLPVRVLLVGCGPHAARTHIPWLRESDLAVPVAIIELKSAAVAAVEAAARFETPIEIVLVDPWAGTTMPSRTQAHLDHLMSRLDVDVVIIATEPLAHGSYLRWAIGTSAHVFVDKPIVALANASNSPEIAQQIEEEVQAVSVAAAAHPDRLVGVGTQRRYHPAFEVVRDLLIDGARRFETPLTAMESTHADGQLRLPHELETIQYHGYMGGIGKVHHSGYHEISLQADLIEATMTAAGTYIDSFTSYASAIRPPGFLKQVPRETYEHQFSKEAWDRACPEDQAVIAARTQRLGELDVFAVNTFHRDGEAVLLSHVGLLHTSVSQRAWLQSNPDLYKGNGRVRHEHHDFRLGPFMSVQVHSYQSRDKHDVNDETESAAGGNNHIEVCVFRNTGWWGSGTRAFERLTADDLRARADMPAGQSFTSFAKQQMLDDFFRCASGLRPLNSHRSRIESHLLGTSMLSAIVESIASKTTTSRLTGKSLRVLGGAA
jgi:predicted dehydrogenase